MTTDDLVDHPLVVLLGEQGMGKSHVLASPRCPLVGELPPVPLGHYSSDDRLERKVLEADWVETWIGGRDVQTLVLDGLDEAQLHIPTVDDLLGDAITQWPVDRLRLRIACRGHTWPAHLQQRLTEAYQAALEAEDFTPTIVSLLPLRREDAGEVAQSLGVDPSAFLAEIDRAGVGSLAGRPLTLRMLIEQFRSRGSLGGSQAELYRAGLRALVTEERDARGRSSTQTADQRLAAAARLAACTVFGGCTTVQEGSGTEGSIGLDDLVGGTEGTGAAQVAVDLATLRSLLGTGLMRSVGDGVFAWAHATFADYLAASWVVENGLSDTQVRTLMVAPDGHLWPQTRLTVGWCVSIAPDQFGWLVECDPVAFVGDVDLPGDELRAVVADAIHDRGHELMARGLLRLGGLAHPGLAEQVRGRLRDVDDDVRWVALELARDCDLVDLRDDLVEMALDGNRDPFERVRACWALVGWGEGRQVPELQPLVSDSPADDETGDDLFGLGLRACWPDTLSTASVLGLVREPQRNNYFGSYANFLQDFAAGLTDADLPAITDWLRRLGPDPVGHHLEKLADTALGIALQHLDDPAVAEVVVDRLIECLARYEPFGFSDDGALHGVSDDDRYALVERVIDRSPPDSVLRAIPAVHPSPLLTGDDLPWLIDKVASTERDRRHAFQTMLPQVFSVQDPVHVRIALSLPDAHPAEPLLMEWFTPQAFALRLQAAEQSRRRTAPRTDDLNEKLEQLLDQFESGDVAAYWRAMPLLSCPVGHKQWNPIPADITSINRWASLSDDQRERVLGCGLTYLEQAECEPERWLGQPVDFHPARAAYCALVLMKTQRPSDLDLVSDDVWRKWAPIIVAWTTTANGALWKDKKPILERAAAVARPELADSLVEMFRGAAARRKKLYAHHELAELMDHDLAARLLDLIDEASIELSIAIVEAVAGYEFELARAKLVHWIDAPSPQFALAEFALGALWDRDPAGSWSLVADRLDGSPELAAQIAGRSMANQDSWRSLSPSTRADIYLWMLTRFPRNEDPEFDEAHVVGPREEAAHRRDDLFHQLVREGTPEAVSAIRRIMDSGLDGVPGRWKLAEAEAHLRGTTWSPVRFPVLSELATRAGSRLVRSADDLLDVVEDAFRSIQRRLTGATPESHLLWNTAGEMSPKGEDEMSDYLLHRIRDELDGRRVVVNREVQVRRVRPTGRPRQVDLQIDAAVDDDIITVPIEVKGSWNDEVETALESQLADQYLSDLGSHGLYVVLFPDLASWSKNESRRTRASRRPMDELMTRLKADAEALADNGLAVRAIGLDTAYAPPQGGGTTA